jgi:hypothetical protein
VFAINLGVSTLSTVPTTIAPQGDPDGGGSLSVQGRKATAEPDQCRDDGMADSTAITAPRRVRLDPCDPERKSPARPARFQ